MTKVDTVDFFVRLTKPNKAFLLKNKTKDRSMNDIVNELIEIERKKKKK